MFLTASHDEKISHDLISAASLLLSATVSKLPNAAGGYGGGLSADTQGPLSYVLVDGSQFIGNSAGEASCEIICLHT